MASGNHRNNDFLERFSLTMGNWKEVEESQFGLRHKDSCAKEDNPDPGVSEGRA
jgi:hypothetical protein